MQRAKSFRAFSSRATFQQPILRAFLSRATFERPIFRASSSNAQASNRSFVPITSLPPLIVKAGEYVVDSPELSPGMAAIAAIIITATTIAAATIRPMTTFWFMT